MPAGAAADYARYSRQRGARNRRIRRTAVAGICALTLLAGVAWWLALKQRDVARTEAATSDRTTQFMVSLFQLADPSENRGNAITVKEVLDKGAAEIRNDKGSNSLSREPRVRAELLTAMGQAYSGLGLYKPSEDLLSPGAGGSEFRRGAGRIASAHLGRLGLYVVSRRKVRCGCQGTARCGCSGAPTPEPCKYITLYSVDGTC